MLKSILIILVFLQTMTFAEAKTDGFFIIKGALRMGSSGSAIQTVSVTNKTPSTFAVVYVECGFFKDSQLLVSAKGITENLGPGEKGYVEIIALEGAANATEADCRVSDVH